MDTQNTLNQKIIWSEITSILLICVLAALYFFMWVRLLGDESLRGMDAISFYTAGRLARAGQYSELYDLDAQRAVQEPIARKDPFMGGLNLSQHPPYLAPLLALIAVDDYIQFYIFWSLIRMVVMLFCMELIRRTLRGSGWGRRPAMLGALGCICFYPVFLGFLGGQDTAFILLGLLFWMFGLMHGQERRAGFGLAFASLSPIIIGLLGIPLLASRRRAGLWFIMGMTILAGYSLLLAGVRGMTDFVGLLTLSTHGQGFGLNQSSMYNLLGLLLRGLASLDPSIARLIAWGAAFSAIVFLTVIWWNKRQRLRLEHIGIAMVVIVFSSPHLHAHGLGYLLLPLIGFMMMLWDGDRKHLALLLVPGLSILMLTTTLVAPEWKYAAAYLIMLGLLTGLTLSLGSRSRNHDNPSPLPTGRGERSNSGNQV